MPFDHPSRRQLLAGLPAAAAAAAAQTAAGAIQAEHHHDPLGPVPLGLHRRDGRQPHEPDAQSRPDGAARRALPLGFLQPAGMRSGARLSIFTGQYPSRHGVWRNAIKLAENAATIAKEMRAGGILRQLHRQVAPRAEQVTPPREGRPRQTRAARRIPGSLGGFEHARVDLARL